MYAAPLNRSSHKEVIVIKASNFANYDNSCTYIHKYIFSPTHRKLE